MLVGYSRDLALSLSGSALVPAWVCDATVWMSLAHSAHQNSEKREINLTNCVVHARQVRMLVLPFTGCVTPGSRTPINCYSTE